MYKLLELEAKERDHSWYDEEGNLHYIAYPGAKEEVITKEELDV